VRSRYVVIGDVNLGQVMLVQFSTYVRLGQVRPGYNKFGWLGNFMPL